jgi:hypothetical protein
MTSARTVSATNAQSSVRLDAADILAACESVRAMLRPDDVVALHFGRDAWRAFREAVEAQRENALLPMGGAPTALVGMPVRESAAVPSDCVAEQLRDGRVRLVRMTTEAA